MITNIPLPDDQDQSRYRICICRAAAAEIYDLSELSLLKTFPISPISNDIPNMESKTGKRKLKYQTCAVTYDGRYFICTNPTVLINEGANKPLDVVDLRTGTSTRYSQPKHTVEINVLFDSFYYLFWEETGEPCLLPPSLYQHKRKDTPHYACLLQSVTEDFISRDHQFGVEFNSRRHFGELVANLPARENAYTARAFVAGDSRDDIHGQPIPCHRIQWQNRETVGHAAWTSGGGFPFWWCHNECSIWYLGTPCVCSLYSRYKYPQNGGTSFSEG